jgi:hypothetical protein
MSFYLYAIARMLNIGQTIQNPRDPLGKTEMLQNTADAYVVGTERTKITPAELDENSKKQPKTGMNLMSFLPLLLILPMIMNMFKKDEPTTIRRDDN